jgi:Xaa-Pro aminopeptidase
LDYRSRIARAADLMTTEGFDALVLSRPNESPSLQYFTGVDRYCANLIIHKDGGSTLLMLEEDLLDAETSTYADKIQTYLTARAQFELIAKTLKDYGVEHGTVGVEKAFLHQGFYESLRATLPTTLQIADATNLGGQLRLIKTEDEITLIRKASAIASKTLQTATESIKPGAAENEIAAIVEYEMRRNGAETTARPTYICSGPRTQAAHPPPSSRKLERDELILIDLHPEFQGYCSDLAATFTTAPQEKLTRQLKQVLEARDAAIQALGIGDKISKLHLEYLRCLSNRDFTLPTIPFLNNIHGVGISPSEPPAFWCPTDVEIQPGMVFTFAQCRAQHPQSKEFGIRFEDTYLAIKSGIERLTSFKHEFD